MYDLEKLFVSVVSLPVYGVYVLGRYNANAVHFLLVGSIMLASSSALSIFISSVSHVYAVLVQR